jgi:hypothetical protein
MYDGDSRLAEAKITRGFGDYLLRSIPKPLKTLQHGQLRPFPVELEGDIYGF